MKGKQISFGTGRCLQQGDGVEHLKSLLHQIRIQFYNSRPLYFFQGGRLIQSAIDKNIW
jgi:hypothetical protein